MSVLHTAAISPGLVASEDGGTAGDPPAADYTPHQATYDQRRLRLHGLIERLPYSHRYLVTPAGNRVAMFFVKLDHCLLRPGLSHQSDGCPKAPNRPLAQAFKQFDRAL